MQGNIANNYSFKRGKQTNKQKLKHSVMIGTGAFFLTRFAEKIVCLENSLNGVLLK